MKRKIDSLSVFSSALALLIAMVATPSIGSAAMKPCEQSFFQVRPMDRYSRAVLNLVRILSAGNSTTGNRVEWKFVGDRAVVQTQLQNLATQYGAKWKLRDETVEGTVNVTATIYKNKQKYRNWEGDERRVKDRARSYFNTDSKDTKYERIKRSRGFEETSWFEIKIQHPTIPRSVIKARVLIYDREIQNLMTDRYTLQRDRLINMMAKLNPKLHREERELFDAIVEYLDASYSTPGRRKEGAFAMTTYTRNSYSVKLTLGDGSTTELQLTVDSNIRLTRLADGQIIPAYGPDQVILEPKVGAQYAAFTPEILKKYPELLPFKEFIDWAESNHDKNLEANKGKLSKIRAIDPAARDRDFDDMADEIFEDFGRK